MAAASSTAALPSIAALPPSTARQIGSGQALVDASSVVKELIDNALDARAKSIFVDIATNTIDTIQVKDDGHGIPREDRSLVCRRYCTSKIRDLNDLRDVGGTWLGFRGEALASMADMSGALIVTTRVEGEPTAVKLKYGRDGELAFTERDSHPVGTTVKVTSFVEYIPVRKQTALKNATKCLAKIRRLIQAYVLARPYLRFRLHGLKAKNHAGDFVYAPKTDASVEDAVMKIFGKDCAMQCGSAAVEADGFKIYAFLPKPTAIGSKISNYGSFVSVDARPVSSQRGTIKQLVRACKDRLGQVNAGLAGVRDLFLCIDINCPPGSYDANVEPAKDDVLFEDSDAVLGALDKLLKSYYPETVANISNEELSLSAPQERELEPDEALSPDENTTLPQGDDTADQNEDMESRPQPRWKTSMYGIDEDDLEFLQDDRAPIVDEEEDCRAIEVSNPWTIARMNAAIKPRQTVTNGQLPSPSKSTNDVNEYSSPLKIPATPSRITSAEPLTPQTSSKTNTLRSSLDDELERSIRRLPKPASVTGNVDDWTGERRSDPFSGDRNSDSLEPELPASVLRSETHAQNNWASSLAGHGNVGLVMATPANRTARPQQSIRDPKLPKPPLRQKRSTNPESPYFQARSQKSLTVVAGQIGENGLHSNNNKDIRDWLRQRDQVRGSNLAQEQSFTPINRPAPSIQPRSPSLLNPVDRNCLAQNERDALRTDSAGPRNMRDHLQAYSERAGARYSSPAESQISMQFDQRSATTHQLPVYKGTFATSPRFHAPSADTGRLSLASPHGNAKPAPHCQPRADLCNKSIDQMNAFFQAHLEKAPAQLSRPAVTTETLEAANSSSHSKLPLRKPTLNLHTSTTVEAIVRQTITRHDRLPRWDCAAEEAYRSLDEQIPEESIAAWVCKLDSLLCALYERVGGIRETRGVLEQGLRRALREGVDAGYGGGDEKNRGVDDVVAEHDGDEYDGNVEEEMLMDL